MHPKSVVIVRLTIGLLLQNQQLFMRGLEVESVCCPILLDMQLLFGGREEGRWISKTTINSSFRYQWICESYSHRVAIHLDLRLRVPAADAK